VTFALEFSDTFDLTAIGTLALAAGATRKVVVDTTRALFVEAAFEFVPVGVLGGVAPTRSHARNWPEFRPRTTAARRALRGLCDPFLR
jgi:hypothetical protein